MSLEPLHLAHPELVHGLWVWLAFAALVLLLERRGTEGLNRLVGRALEDRLVERPAVWRRRLRWALQGLSGLFMVVALMQPQWGERFVATPRVGAEIMIALDVSRSMLADDAKPSRLERAKAEIADLLAYLEDDQVGLIAFAGRASILSPMTPDKSFLRLALDGAGPHSVSRGGTSLAEPIVRAVAGLGEPGPAQRALILITDGEDHDSFALDAAKKAAAAGIKIITIGFGDEGGSPIHVVDPDDGSRELVRDADGSPVMSRLNGELLREIALATDGAYVPAGTGVLDLASIYETHIARLTRGQLDARGRSVRGELYPIFVAAALVCLVAGTAVGAGGRRGAGRLAARPTTGRSMKDERGAAMVGPLAVLVALAVLPSLSLVAAAPVRAADPGSAADPAEALAEAPTAAADASPAAETESAEARPESVEEDPRSRFNRANERLAAGEAELASTLYREVRRDAVDDLELRYAASYNLGMAAVARADARQATDPSEALVHLHEAADWFREAAAMQPDEADPRHNLDVTLRRALILADEIARQGRRDVEQELDALIEAQRGRVGEAALLLEAVVRAGELEAAESLRAAFEDAATAERALLADAESVAERVADERAMLEAKAESERTPEEGLRSASLEGVLDYLDQGVERMGQMRRQLRQRSAERAYRRGSESLSLLKRARDQLRDPVEQLGVLLAEVTGVAQATGALAGSPDGATLPLGEGARRPAFLTPDAIEAETAAVAARVGELAERFATAAADAARAGSAAGASGPSGTPPAPAPGDPASGSPELSEALRAALEDAAPLVEDAHASMDRATAAVAGARFAQALAADGEAARALAEAQELFFDLRQLLDTAHATQARIAVIAGSEEPAVRAERAKGAAVLSEAQHRNRERATRLASLLASERESQRQALLAPEAGTPADPSSEPPPPPDPAQLEALAQRFDRADALLAQAKAAMDEAQPAFATPGSSRATDWSRVGEAAGRAAVHLEALRLLFLSLVEQLERLEREQVDLTDRTRDAIALAAADTPANAARGADTRARVTALDAEQKGLEGRAGAIADALLARSEQVAASPEPASGAAPAPDPDTLRRAADHVATAQLAMQEASETFGDESRPLPPAADAQGVARDELRKALALLAPPPPPQDESEGEKKEEESGAGEQPPPPSEGSESSASESESESEPEPESEPGEGDEQQDAGAGADEGAGASEDQAEQEPGSLDPAQLLQGVRDREAERRDANERKARARRRSAPVEKDW